MRILVALHNCMDLGGIIDHTEQLIGGLKYLGHEVELKEFIYSERHNAQAKEGPWTKGPSGIPHAQGKGWNFPKAARVPYKGPRILDAVRILNSYDAVIWTVPVPPKNKPNMGNDKWPILYRECKARQIAFVHDGNAAKNSFHMLEIEDELKGVACVHDCAFNGSSFLNIPRARVLNPQLLSDKPYYVDWNDKFPGFVNMQTFKGWKRVPDLIEAIAYMPPIEDDELREVAGEGIEYRYLTSEDKCKPAYFHENGERFWDSALENGMTHHGYWNKTEVAEFLAQARVLVDPSYSANYIRKGAHFNRVAVDAIIQGVIPVVHSGMYESPDLFVEDVNYIALPERGDPQEYADIILDAGNMPMSKADEMRKAAWEMIQPFDRVEVAKSVVELIIEEHTETSINPNMDIDLAMKSSDLMLQHFGAESLF